MCVCVCIYLAGVGRPVWAGGTEHVLGHHAGLRGLLHTGGLGAQTHLTFPQVLGVEHCRDRGSRVRPQSVCVCVYAYVSAPFLQFNM